MQATEIQPYKLNTPDYKKSITDGEDFYLQFHIVSHETDILINKIIHRYLGKYNILFVKETIISIAKELINNAVKANLKRLYFKIQGLEINKIEDYRKGMETFKKDTFQDNTLQLMEKINISNLVVRLAFKTDANNIYINVINNIPILDSELNKINSRIKKSLKYTDLADAFEDVLDDSEGAGLGLIMAMMVLKNCGIPSKNFIIYKKGELTIAKLIIPQRLTKIEHEQHIAEEILKEIDDIPALPENIKTIQKHCNNPDATIKQIATSISRDPGLTTSILKLANSAGYITSKKVKLIEDAVKIIGIKGINTLLVATGVQKVFNERYKKYESIWKNSFKRAYYAHKISIQIKKTRLSEFAYLGGLLSDIGKIIMLSINPEKLSHLKEIAGKKGINETSLLEEISLGISHNKIGGLICQKWKFNDTLINAIELHERPHMAEGDIKRLVYIIYLADTYVKMENKKIKFELIDEDVLHHFNINNIDSFSLLHNVLQESYSNQTDM